MNKVTRNIATLIAFGIGTTSIGFAQVTQQKIGNNPTIINQNAALEVESTNKGILLPRLGLTATNSFAPLTAHVAGMTVYNTATAGTAPNNVTPGYYYNDGTQWVRVATGADAKTEPWRQQNTTNEATANSQNIYQTGNVAIGDFSTAASTKKMEVKGTFKAEDLDGNIAYGTEMNHPALPAQSVSNYRIDNSTGAYKMIGVHPLAALMQAKTATVESTVAVNDTHSEMSSRLISGTTESARSIIRTESPGNFYMEAYNSSPSLNFGSTFSLQDDALRLVHSTTGGPSLFLSDNNRSEIMVQKGEGVRFDFKNASGATNGQYWFPITTGAAGEVMTQTASGKMVWTSASALVAEVDGVIGNEVTDATTNGGLTRAGAGTTVSPYTLGLLPGTTAGNVMTWNGTAWNPAAPVNIYNANGALTNSRQVNLNGNNLRFTSPERDILFDSNGRIGLEAKGTNDGDIYVASGTGANYSRVDLQSFPGPGGQVNLTATGAAEQMTIATHATTVAAPIIFSTSSGSNALGTEKMRVTGTGELGIDTDTPTERLDVGSGNVRVRDINTLAGNTATDKMVVADVDGVLKTTAIPSSTNIYNANGTLTSARTLTLGGFPLNFDGAEQTVTLNSFGWLQLDGKGSNSSFMRMSTTDGNANGAKSNFDMQLFPDNMMQLYATGEVSRITLGTHETLNPSPIEFATSPGTNTPGQVRMIITGTGNIGVNTPIPTEKLDNDGITRLRNLPLNGAVNAINTTSTGSASSTQDQTFTATRTVVADANGVLGTVAGIPAAPVNIYTANGTLTANRTVTMGSNTLRFQNTANGNILFNMATTGVGGQSITGTNRGNLTLNGGAATVDLFVDDAAPAQLTIRGNATSLDVGSTTGQAKPLNLITNGVTRATVTSGGEVAIGATTAPSFVVGGLTIQPKLYVAGDISTTGKIWTTNSVYADYVFEKYFKGNSDIKPDYEFRSLDYVKEFIEEKHHLPGVESISNLSKTENGYTFDVTKLTVQSLEKIEELYLHTIELKEKLDVQYKIGEQQEKIIQSQQKELEELKNRFSRLEELLIKQ